MSCIENFSISLIIRRFYIVYNERKGGKNMIRQKTNDRKKDNYGGAYKVVEAMYRQGYSNE